MDSVAFLPDGSKVVATGEAQDIVRRVREGDPSKGWEGDPSMRVVVSPYEGIRSHQVRYVFEVWGLDAHGEPYLACVSETCGPELIEKLVKGDTRKRDPFAEMRERMEKADRERKQALSDHHEAVADKLAFVLQGDNAAHFGGKGRLIPVPDAERLLAR